MAAVAVIVAAVRITSAPHVNTLRAVLSDLQAQILDRTPRVEAEQVRWTRLRIWLIVVLLVALALGAWMAFTFGG